MLLLAAALAKALDVKEQPDRTVRYAFTQAEVRVALTDYLRLHFRVVVGTNSFLTFWTPSAEINDPQIQVKLRVLPTPEERRTP